MPSPLVPGPPGRAANPAACIFDDQLTAKDFDLFRQLIYDHSGICLSLEKKNLLRNRLTRRLRQIKLPSFREYYNYVIQDQTGQELIQLINCISTNLTYFFREGQHFELLRQRLIPELLAEKRRAGDRRLRIWSAACSTGEEAYSLLFTFLPLLEPLSAWDFKLLGTDISTKVLAVARSGGYDQELVRGLDVTGLAGYFDRGGGMLRVKQGLRQMVTFARVNLHEPFPFKGPFEVIFCRNVMIYFDQATRERLVNRFFDYLSPGGYLFIGHSENLTGLRHSLSYFHPAVYRK
jgi:chemotaxis protein methyltransferase CheR